MVEECERGAETGARGVSDAFHSFAPLTRPGQDGPTATGTPSTAYEPVPPRREPAVVALGVAPPAALVAGPAPPAPFVPLRPFVLSLRSTTRVRSSRASTPPPTRHPSTVTSDRPRRHPAAVDAAPARTEHDCAGQAARCAGSQHEAMLGLLRQGRTGRRAWPAGQVDPRVPVLPRLSRRRAWPFFPYLWLTH